MKTAVAWDDTRRHNPEAELRGHGSRLATFAEPAAAQLQDPRFGS